jgi:hypothetical protein
MQRNQESLLGRIWTRVIQQQCNHDCKRFHLNCITITINFIRSKFSAIHCYFFLTRHIWYLMKETFSVDKIKRIMRYTVV